MHRSERRTASGHARFMASGQGRPSMTLSPSRRARSPPPPRGPPPPPGPSSPGNAGAPSVAGSRRGARRRLPGPPPPGPHERHRPGPAPPLPSQAPPPLPQKGNGHAPLDGHRRSHMGQTDPSEGRRRGRGPRARGSLSLAIGYIGCGASRAPPLLFGIPARPTRRPPLLIEAAGAPSLSLAAPITPAPPGAPAPARLARAPARGPGRPEATRTGGRPRDGRPAGLPGSGPS
jgi:hypothetical protein